MSAEQEVAGGCCLVSKEGDQFKVSRKLAMLSTLCGTMLEDANADEEPLLPLPAVPSAILARIVTFCVHYLEDPMKEIPKPLPSTDMVEAAGEWYAAYAAMPQDDLMDVILAANYMDLRPLLELACAKVASQVKGKTIDEIRTTFGIVNDFTPEEEAQVREENRWIDDPDA